MLAEANLNLQKNGATSEKIIFDTTIFNQLERFFRRVYKRSVNTGAAYEGDVRHFFQKTREKDIEHLRKEDLVFTIDEFEDYYYYLIDVRKVSINTANRHIVSISECIKHLSSRGLIDDVRYLNIRKHSANVDRYGVLTIEEALKMAELVTKHGDEEMGQTKRLMILFALDTCARLGDCLNLKWSNFKENETDVGISLMAKGNKEFKPSISKEFYQELLTLQTDGEDKVFHIHRNTVNNMMKWLRDQMNISEERNIVFHSFKKAGVNFVWKNTGDINQARKAANHSNIKTTDIYINKEENYGIMGAVSSKQGVDHDLYNQVSHEELLQAINSLGKDTQMYINLQLDKLRTEID